MAINLFLDANILLSFYSLSNADISQLRQLKEVVKKGDICLFVNQQLCDEVERNREVKISESFKVLKDGKFRCQAPSFVREMEGFAKLQEYLNKANAQHSDLVDSVNALIQKRELDADVVIKELLAEATIHKVEKSQFNAAHIRFLTGNPPGKKKATFGDEINWEFLLDKVPKDQDLHLVSADGDYASIVEPGKANGYLLREWREKKSSELIFYKDLQIFFNEHVPKIKLANQAKMSALIVELSASSTFSETHSILAKFPDDAEFTDAQVVELVNVRENNSQIYWIKDDADVSAFYSPILAKYAEMKQAGKL